jgi:hypothetical protein
MIRDSEGHRSQMIQSYPFEPMSVANQNHEATLASLSELNHSLRQQVVQLLLSIAILKETAGPGPGAIPSSQ